MCNNVCRAYNTIADVVVKAEVEKYRHEAVLEQWFFGERHPMYPEPKTEDLLLYNFAMSRGYNIDEVTITVAQHSTPNVTYFGAVVEFPEWIVKEYQRHEHQILVDLKREILTELYKYGTLNNIYFSSVRTNKINPIKNYIESLIKRLGLNPNANIIDDCYNEAFVHLQRKTPAKIVEIYREAPNKLIATTLCIIQNKCFAIDPRYGNPKHSLVQSILFASSVGGSDAIDPVDYFDEDDPTDRQEVGGDTQDGSIGKVTCILDEGEQEEGFTKLYGFTIEDIISHLNAQQKAVFYGMIGTQPRGKVSASKQRERDALIQVIINLKKELSV